MHRHDWLNTEALSLIRRALDGLDDKYGAGTLTCAIYDTAWVSLVSKKVQGEEQWAFPGSFQYILDAQCADGSWGRNSACQIDGILNTAASLLSLKRHHVSSPTREDASDHLRGRIDRAVVSLRSQLAVWDVAATTHVGFEIIVPAMLRYLQQEDETLIFEFDGRETLDKVHGAKMSCFKPEMLYGDVPYTALHSLESFIGLIEFNRVSHHLVNGAMMASPAATAAYLINASGWDHEAEGYLQHVIACGAGKCSGGVPSAYPSMHFEYTWMLSTLCRAGFSSSDLQGPELQRITQLLLGAFESGSGVIGFAPFLPVDLDDTSKCIVSLFGLGHPMAADRMIEAFEAEYHFRTYAQERDASLSANCNALSALLCQSNVIQYSSQIVKIVRFLCDRWWNADGKLTDKWNQSDLYSSLLLTESLVDLLVLIESGVLESILDSELQAKVFVTLFQIGLRTLLRAQEDGSWNFATEETAFAVLILCEARRLSTWVDLQQPLNQAIQRGIAFICRHRDTSTQVPIWIEKVSYTSSLLTDCYVLAALKSASSPYNPAAVRASLQSDHAAVKMRKVIGLLQQTPLFYDTPKWQMQASGIESLLFQPLLRGRRLDVFPRSGMQEDKYFDIIPLTWTACNNRLLTFASTALIYEMMVISFLNYQVDEFMEVVAGAAFRDRISSLRACIDGMFSGTKGRANGSKGILNHHDDDKSTSLDILLPVHKFVAHVLSHPDVMQASRWDKQCVERELRIFLHAHATQNEDNARFRMRQENGMVPHKPESLKPGESCASGEDTFFHWVRTTSADHTSCPYSFHFLNCLLSSHVLNGAECFPTVHDKYLAEASCRHLASMCRMYNDYGSVARDEAEQNVNSINFGEFCASGSIKDKKRALFALAQYERSCLDEAKSRLGRPSPEDASHVTTSNSKVRQMQILQMFCDVTDLYGQIYVVRDIASRMVVS